MTLYTFLYSNHKHESFEQVCWSRRMGLILMQRSVLQQWSMMMINGSALPIIDTYGLMFQTSPPHSNCTSNRYGIDRVLFLKSNRTLEYALSLQCAVIPLCDVISNCMRRMCFSEDAFLQGNHIMCSYALQLYYIILWLYRWSTLKHRHAVCIIKYTVLYCNWGISWYYP